MSKELTVEETTLKTSIQAAMVACDARDYALLLEAAVEISGCETDRKINALDISAEELAHLKEHLEEFGETDLAGLTQRIVSNELGLSQTNISVVAANSRIDEAEQKIIAAAQSAENARDGIKLLVADVNTVLGQERDRLTLYKQTNDERVALTESNINLLLQSSESFALRLVSLEDCCDANKKSIQDLVTGLQSVNNKIDVVDERLTSEVVRVDKRIDELDNEEHTGALDVLQMINDIQSSHCAQRASAINLVISAARIKHCNVSIDVVSSKIGAAASI